MKKYVNTLKTAAKRSAVAVGGLTVAGGAMAADYSDQINAVVADGQSNLTLVVTGVIGLAAITFAVGALVSWLRR